MIAETHELLRSIHEKIKVNCHVSAIYRDDGLEIYIVAKVKGVLKDYHRIFEASDFVNPQFNDSWQINYMCEVFNRELKGES